MQMNENTHPRTTYKATDAVHTYTNTHIYKHTHTQMHTHVHMHTHTHTHTHLYKHACTSTHTYTSTHAQTHTPTFRVGCMILLGGVYQYIMWSVHALSVFSEYRIVLVAC